MIFTKTNATVKSLCHPKGNKFKKIRLDLIWQRQFVWNTEKSSLFLHTLMTNGYVYPILVADEEDSSDVLLLDGLQRISTCRKFIAGDMKLDANTPMVGEEDVAKKSFKQLPTELQDAILDYSFDLVYVKGATEDDLGELFNRLNQAQPITRTTLIRAEAGVEVAKYLESLEQMDFFAKRMVVSASARKTHGVTESVLQSLSLFLFRNKGFASRDLKSFALAMKDNAISEQDTKAFVETIEYLQEAFPEVETEEGEKDFEYSNLKKSVVPLIVKAGEACLYNGVDAVDFFDWSEKFFSGKDHLGNSFKSYSASGTSAKKNIRKRMEIMLKSLAENFQNFEIPDTCNFAIWDEQEEAEKAEAERVKAEKKAIAQAKREATKAAKLAKAEAKRAEQDAMTAKAEEALKEVLGEDTEEDEVVSFAEGLDEDSTYDVLTGTRTVSESEFEEALSAIFS